MELEFLFLTNFDLHVKRQVRFSPAPPAPAAAADASVSGASPPCLQHRILLVCRGFVQVYDLYRESLMDWHRRACSTSDWTVLAAERELVAKGVPRGCLWEVQCPGGPRGPPSPLDGGGMEVEGDVAPDDAMAME